MHYDGEDDYLLFDPHAEEAETRPIGEYGRLRRAFLENNRPLLLQSLRLKGQLDRHLADVDAAARVMLARLVAEMDRRYGAPATQQDPEDREQRLPAYRRQAEKIVLAELIYK